MRETWAAETRFNALAPRDIPRSSRIWHLADGPKPAGAGKTRTAIHMPRWASRITLEVTSVRVERLQAITEEDARAEGFEWREHFLRAWTEMYGGPTEPMSVEADPWVWVVTFRRVEAP